MKKIKMLKLIPKKNIITKNFNKKELKLFLLEKFPEIKKYFRIIIDDIYLIQKKDCILKQNDLFSSIFEDILKGDKDDK